MRHKIIAMALCLAFLFTPSAMAQDEKPYDMVAAMEKELPDFGDKPWEQELKEEAANHKSKVKLSCIYSEEQRVKKIIAEKERIRKEKERKERLKREKEERERLLKEQAETQDQYTNEQNEKIIAETEGREWKSLGSKRITHFCPGCNTPVNSYSSSSGVKLFEGAVACRWLPIGSIVKINGKVYKNLDTCGTSAIDIFLDTPNGCSCDSAGSYSTEVFLLK